MLGANAIFGTIGSIGIALGSLAMPYPKQMTIGQVYDQPVHHGIYRLDQVEVTGVAGPRVTLSDGKHAIEVIGDIPNGKRYLGNAQIIRQGDNWVLARWNHTVLSAECGVPEGSIRVKRGELGVSVEGKGWVRFNEGGIFDY